MLIQDARRTTQYAIYLLGFSFILSGCIVRTYPLTKDRVDQDLTGNRGYLQGAGPAVETQERKTTRRTQVVEIELHPPIKFEKAPKQRTLDTGPVEKTEDNELWGNRGYLTQSQTPEMTEAASVSMAQGARFQKYTVKKTDTLQKISKEIYRTTKKWRKIFEANSDTLKSPDKIYPGQVINVPVESLKEPRENLK